MTLRSDPEAHLALTLYESQGPIPDPTLTPGAVRTTDVADICSTPTRELRQWSGERDNRILGRNTACRRARIRTSTWII
jgi:hypothetical protein